MTESKLGINGRILIRNSVLEMTPDKYQKKVYAEKLTAEEMLGRGPWFEDERGSYAIVPEFANLGERK